MYTRACWYVGAVGAIPQPTSRGRGVLPVVKLPSGSGGCCEQGSLSAERNFPQRLDLHFYPGKINRRQGGLCTGSSMSNYGPTVSD